MSFRSASASPQTPSTGEAAEAGPDTGPTDVLAWARTVWEDRETWLQARGGVESVFMAAQLLGCREAAADWLKTRSRL